MPMPTLFGHEFSGQIADIGRGVTSFSEGDPVMSVHSASCGRCYYCQHGQDNLCELTMEAKILGAYAEYIRVPSHIVETNMYHKPATLSFNEAAILEPLACVVHGLEFLRFSPDDTVVIIGAGAIGLMHLILLRALGIERVIMCGRRSFRLKLAAELGAAIVIDGEREDTEATLQELTHGRGADIVVECTGKPDVWQQAVTLVRRGGKVVLFGGCPSGSKVELDTSRIHYDQITLLSPFHYTRQAVRKAYEVLSEKRIEAAKLITGEYPLDKLKEVFALLQHGNCVKYAVIP
jgi:L-iditol 2-dehydrogenase